jgi:hypothetical protein
MAHAKVRLVEETPFFVHAKKVKTGLGVQMENLVLARTSIEALERKMT